MTVRAFLRYRATRVGVAWLLPLPVIAVQWILGDQSKPYAWYLFYPLLFFAPLIGGLWGGVGATFISAMLVWYLFLPPQDSVAIEEWGSRLSIFWFVASGIVFSLLLDGVRRRDARYRTLFAAAGDGIARVDSMGRYREVNDRYCQLLGRMRSEFVGAHLSDMVVDVTPEYVTTINAQIAATGRATFQCRLRHRDGSFPSVEMTVADVGRSERIAIVRDIGEHKRAELALAASEARLQAVIDNTSDRIWSVDREYRLLVANGVLQDDMKQLAGYELQIGESVLGGPYVSQLRDRWQPLFDRGLAGESFSVEQPSALRAGGTIEIFVNPIRDAGGGVIGVAVRTVDITDRIQTELKTREALQQLRLAKEAAGIGVWNWNFADESLEWDDRIYAFYGVPVDQPGLVYDIWRSRVHPEDIEQIESSLAEARRTGQDWSATFRVLLPDGCLRYIYSAAVVERNRQGEPVRMIGINSDVTDQKLYEQYMQDANALLARANAAKDAFMAAVSHELRTPLTGILGMADALEQQMRGPLTEHQARYVGLIHANGQRLLELVNSILFYTGLTAGRVPVQHESCRLADLCAISVRALKDKAAEKEQTIAVDVDPADLTIVSDADLITRILILLLDNAVKFTGQQAALGVRVGCAPAGEAVRLVVWDQGVGIEAAKLPYLFDSFTQIDQRLARRYEGVGIGLASVHKLVHLLGGSVTVQSELGKGSQFTVTLPMAPD